MVERIHYINFYDNLSILFELLKFMNSALNTKYLSISIECRQT